MSNPFPSRPSPPPAIRQQAPARALPPTGGSRNGLVAVKVPVHRAHGVFNEIRWISPAQAQALGMHSPQEQGIPGTLAAVGIPSAVPPSTPEVVPSAATGVPGGGVPSAGAPAPSLLSQVEAMRQGAGAASKRDHATGGLDAPMTGHGSYDKLRHLPIQRLRNRARRRLAAGRVKSFIQHAAHDVARSFSRGIDEASLRGHLAAHYGDKAAKFASHVAVKAVGHALAHLKSMALQGSREALSQLHMHGHDPLVRLAHARLAHHERGYQKAMGNYERARQSHLALLQKLAHDSPEIAQAMHLHRRAKAAFNKLPESERTPERRAKMQAISENLHKAVLKSGNMGRVQDSFAKLQKHEGVAMHHSKTHAALRSDLDRYHDAAFSFLAHNGHLSGMGVKPA